MQLHTFSEKRKKKAKQENQHTGGDLCDVLTELFWVLIKEQMEEVHQAE